MSEIIYEDDYIQVIVLDDKGAGGAHHKYSITCKDVDPEKGGYLELGHVQFQNGAILENGVNGLTNEVLLAIVGHRLECFQDGPFPSDFNAAALHGVDLAKLVLEMRTQDRKDRGVEGQTKA
ncbi:MAG: ABC transporter ATPase [Candidatus Poribacteria bacterium]|nr:ABC transporter ATPase [Candidatus Poribacteria bacterium]